MAQRLFSAVIRAFGQSPARLSRNSGNLVSAPRRSSISRTRLTRPCRSQRWHLIFEQIELALQLAKRDRPAIAQWGLISSLEP